MPLKHRTIMYEDNQACQKLVETHKQYRKTKHIDIKYHFVRDHYRKGDILIKYCSTHKLWADSLTKPVEGKTYNLCKSGFMNLPNEGYTQDPVSSESRKKQRL